MTFQKEIKQTIGNDVYEKLDNEAKMEVSLALKMPLQDQYGQDKYYRTRFFIPKILPEYELFEEKGLTISPADIVNVLFKCKMLFVVDSEDEYKRRVDGVSFVDENHFVVPWNKKSNGLDSLINEYLDRLRGFLSEKTLIVEINSFYEHSSNHQEFFDSLFKTLGYPFAAYIVESKLIENHKKRESG